MNIVLVKHNEISKQFAFYVPDELVPFVKKGQGVLCSTMHGLAYATTTTGVISGDGWCEAKRRLPEVEHELDALFEALAEVRA